MEDTLKEYLKKLTEVFSEIKRILKKNGILWLNIGDGYTSGNRGYRAPDKKNKARSMRRRPNTPEGLKEKELLGVPWKLVFSLQEIGWYLRSEIIWHKPNGMPESVKDRPFRNHEYIFMLTKSKNYFFNSSALIDGDGKRRRSVWSIVNSKSNHIASFPEELISPLVKASTIKNSWVLDPFFGSGTVGLVCKNFHRKYVGIEINKRFVRQMIRKLNYDPKIIFSK